MLWTEPPRSTSGRGLWNTEVFACGGGDGLNLRRITQLVLPQKCFVAGFTTTMLYNFYLSIIIIIINGLHLGTKGQWALMGSSFLGIYFGWLSLVFDTLYSPKQGFQLKKEREIKHCYNFSVYKTPRFIVISISHNCVFLPILHAICCWYGTPWRLHSSFEASASNYGGSGTGFVVIPFVGSTVIVAICVFSADTSVNRDPSSFELYVHGASIILFEDVPIFLIILKFV